MSTSCYTCFFRFRQMPFLRNLVMLFLLGSLVPLVAVGLADADDSILILYDSAGPYDHIGKEHAILLQNLLGHFNMQVVAKPVRSYSTGEMQNHTATFYIGATFDEQSYYETDSREWQNYENFLADAAAGDETLIWMNYNILALQEKMDTVEADSFVAKYGFLPQGVVNNQYNRVYYKKTELYKGVVPFANPGADLTGCIDEGEGRYACSTELNALTLVDTQMTEVYATTTSTLVSTTETPYITRSGHFWFVGDLPFMYLSEEDRYLAFADVLHDMLRVDHPETHQALVRIEDVHSEIEVAELKTITDYLTQADIPFSVATIAQYRDNWIYGKPLGVSDTGRLLKSLYRRGQASIIAHGYTHQKDTLANPYNGISGDDFEFYRVTMNADNSLNFVSAFLHDTQRSNQARMQKASLVLRLAGLRPFCWEAPHYLASENGYLGIRRLFPIHYGRLTYFNQVGTDTHVIGFGRRPHPYPYWGQEPHMMGQFFPYLIYKDIYGYKVIPENLGNIEPAPYEGYRPLYPEDLIRHAQKNLVVRDGVASFFYHTDLGTQYLEEVVEGVQDLGYTFVAADKLIQ